MVRKCPKCGSECYDDATYCQNCGFGLTPDARTLVLYAAGGLLLMSSAGSVLFLALSATALLNVYQWYPPFVGAESFLYDEVFTLFALAGSLFGPVACALTFLRKHYEITFVAAFGTLISVTGALFTSLIQPFSVLWQSILYYFFPLFLPSFVATLLIYYRSAEFAGKRTRDKS